MLRCAGNLAEIDVQVPFGMCKCISRSPPSCFQWWMLCEGNPAARSSCRKFQVIQIAAKVMSHKIRSLQERKNPDCSVGRVVPWEPELELELELELTRLGFPKGSGPSHDAPHPASNGRRFRCKLGKA